MSCGERFDHVVRHIEANLFEPLSVGGLAAVAGLSSFHFSRLFTAQVGERVMSHVKRQNPKPLISLVFYFPFSGWIAALIAESIEAIKPLREG